MNYPQPMVSIDTRPPEIGADEPAVRPYSSNDVSWALEVLEATGGRLRVRRGKVVDVAALPGLVGLRFGQPSALLTFARHRDELELAVLAGAPFDDHVVSLLLSAAQAYATGPCRRIWTICSNAEFDVQRVVQQHGFRMCTTRPGSMDAVRRRSAAELPAMLGGVPVRDEVEFDLLLR